MILIDNFVMVAKFDDYSVRRLINSEILIYYNCVLLCYLTECLINLEILCLHSGIIINTDNDITYNRESYEFITATLNMSL